MSHLARYRAGCVIIVLLMAAPAFGAESPNYTMTTQARWALIATWAGLTVGFLGVLMTIRRDRASARRDIETMQEASDARVRQIVLTVLNDPEFRARVDNRTREVARSMAYEEFRYDRADTRLAQMEDDVRALQAKLDRLGPAR
jgi:hypothetical protein